MPIDLLERKQPRDLLAETLPAKQPRDLLTEFPKVELRLKERLPTGLGLLADIGKRYLKEKIIAEPRRVITDITKVLPQIPKVLEEERLRIAEHPIKTALPYLTPVGPAIAVKRGIDLLRRIEEPAYHPYLEEVEKQMEYEPKAQWWKNILPEVKAQAVRMVTEYTRPSTVAEIGIIGKILQHPAVKEILTKPRFMPSTLKYKLDKLLGKEFPVTTKGLAERVRPEAIRKVYEEELMRIKPELFKPPLKLTPIITPAPPTVPTITPPVITPAIETMLDRLGYTESQIGRMLPQVASRIAFEKIPAERVSILRSGKMKEIKPEVTPVPEVKPAIPTLPLTSKVELEKLKIIGIEKVPSAGFMELGKGISEIDKIQIEPEPKDLVGFKGFIKSYLAPVRHVVGDDPIANQIARMGRDTMANLTAEQSHYSERIDKAFKGLNPNEKEMVINYLEGTLPLEIMPDKLKPAYSESSAIRSEMLKEAEAMGKDIAKWKIPPEQYWPHIFVGQYQIMDGSKTIEGGFARSLDEALTKAQLYLRDKPSADIKIKPRDIGGEYTSTLLSRKGFWRFISEVNKATELDRDEILGLMKGVAAIKPRGKFVGNWQQRAINLGGYLKDPVALKIYTNRILRKKWIDPFARQATDLASQLPPALREYMDEYTNAIRGQYNPFDNKWQISRLTGRWTGLQSMLKLGYRPISALINRLQPLQTAYGEIGSYLFKGTQFKNTAEGKRVIEESGIRGQLPKYYTGEFLAMPKTPLWKPLGMFSKAEMANREDVISGGYLFAKKVFSMSPEKISRMGYDYILDYLTQFKDTHRAALEYAKDLNADTNYIYDVSDLPKIFRTPFLRPALQFKTYPINFISQSVKWLGETIRNPTSHNIARAIRFTGMNTLLAGPRSIPYVGKYAWKWLVGTAVLGFLHPKTRDKLARGIFSWLGVDLSQRLGPNEFLPRNIRDLLGPTSGDLYNIYKYLQGQQSLGQTISNFSGAVRDIYEAIRSGSRIEDPNRRWRMIAEATGWEKFMQAIGAPLVKETLNRDMQWLITDLTEQYKNRRTFYIDKIIEYRRQGKPIADIIKQARDEGIPITYDDIREEIQKKETPALYRRLQIAPKILRGKFAKQIEELFMR